ncbi:MAG: hypothetical protein HKN67_07780 [Saprospiraceae bacterium]|nr:hypothetical protein [Saprospiraceae bacterium]NNK90243.1 hypothetical protein [Saprospiraceae bacterium]
MVYRDRGFNKEIDAFNQDLEHTNFEELVFEKKKVDVFNVLGMDSVFQVMYGFFEKDSMHFMVKRYDKFIQLRDSSTFIKIHKRDIRKRIGSVESEDKSKVLLYTFDIQNRFVYVLYDNRRKKVIRSQKVYVENADLRNDILEIQIMNSGKFLLVLNEDQKFEDSDVLRLLLFDISFDGYKSVRMNFSSFYRKSYFLDFDNLNGKIIICGTYSEKRGKETKGFYYINRSIDDLTGNERVYFIDFDLELQNEIMHGKKKKSRIFDDLEIKDIINRNDGGFLIVSEIAREFSRRNPYNNSYSRSTYNGYSRRGWIDYYNDDILISNINSENVLEWTEVLYKKQFSQDDEAVFSSFYLMKTPSRMRFIYNDEIKSSNTVSEYIMDPIGNIARNSLLTTEYQNMKLRFQDAVQLSSNSILVPSEKNYNLNLVRITY